MALGIQRCHEFIPMFPAAVGKFRCSGEFQANSLQTHAALRSCDGSFMRLDSSVGRDPCQRLVGRRSS